MTITKEGHNYLINRNDGVTVVLTCIEADQLMTYIRRDNLRYLIDDMVDNAEADWLDLSKYEFTRDDFIQEIFDNLADEIDYGNPVTEEQVEEQINDLGTFYKLEKEY